MERIIAIANQKGGSGKTTTAINLGAALSRMSKSVLMVDLDPQGSLTASMGFKNPDNLENTIADIFRKKIADDNYNVFAAVRRHEEGMDLIPANIDLAAVEAMLVSVMSRERMLEGILSEFSNLYDYIIIDCMPSLGMLAINALACADSVIIPVQAEYLPIKGLQQLFSTIGKIRKQINPKLTIGGVLFTMIDARTNNSKAIMESIRTAYGNSVKVFDTTIPRAVRATESTAAGKSLFEYDPAGSVTEAYRKFAEEVYGA